MRFLGRFAGTGLTEKTRLAELDALLNMGKGRPEILDSEPEQEDEREIECIKPVNQLRAKTIRQKRQVAQDTAFE